MLVLTFQIGTQRLALDVRRIREVVPRVPPQPLVGAPPWLAGLFVYRGQAVPLLDLHRLLGAGECPPHLSSRIILVPWQHDGEERLLGLLAAQVADIREVKSPPSRFSGLASPGQLDLGPILVEEDGLLHLLEPERLLPETLQHQLAALPGRSGP
jgi:chemotaxis-related protein WspB